MNILQRMRASDPYLWCVIAFAVLVRLVGIMYGLPLTLVSDEPPFTFAALQMLQLKTLIPALHPTAFSSILYYPPYLSYLYLPFFTSAIGIEYLILNGVGVVPHLLANLTPFFLVARAINVVLAAASVYLVYQCALALFRSRAAALMSAFLLATSIIHIALSMVGRHWLPESLLFLLVLFTLTRDWPENKRLGWSLLVAGFGMGVSSISLLIVLFVGLYWIFFGQITIREMLRDHYLRICALLALALGALPSFLYQNGNGFLTDITLFASKSIPALFASPLSVISLTLFSEPVLMLAFLAGLVLLFKKYRQLFAFSVSWFLFYAVMFYTFFRFDPRFFLPLVPLYAIIGGYFLGWLWTIPYHFSKSGKGLSASLVILLIFLPLIASLRVSYLALHNDPRALARAWVLEHLAPGDKVLVYANLLRVSTTKAAVEELRAIDVSAPRRIDEADESLDLSLPHALNLYTVENDTFFAGLREYARAHGYRYLAVDPTYIRESPLRERAFFELAQGAESIVSWKGCPRETSLAWSQFLDPVSTLFACTHLGPDIVIYRLPQ